MDALRSLSRASIETEPFIQREGVTLAHGGSPKHKLDMPKETALRFIAFGCAIFMLFGFAGGRTTWVHRNGSSTTDAAGYNMAAMFSGVVALAALTFALWLRERGERALPVLGALVAVAAFALSVLASGVYVWARWQGEIWFYGVGGFAGDPGRKETVHLAWGPPFFALAALIGALASLALAVTWLRKAKGAW